LQDWQRDPPLAVLSTAGKVWLNEPMLEDQPSRTAHRVALRRAAHQLWDNPRVLDDPIALKIIPAEASAELAGSRPSGSAPAHFLRAFMVARSRFAEDHLLEAVARDVKQYVVLGAGLDTFAYRNPFQDLHVFEVDYPATQAWKRERLQLGKIPVPSNLTFAPVDFEKDTLHAGLEKAGFNASKPAFFSWLGVTPYLAEATVLATLRWIAQYPENGVAFDYTVPRSSLSFFQRLAFDALSARVAAAGEPFIGFFDPSVLSLELQQMGFKKIEDLGMDEINALYFAERTDGLRMGGGLARLMCATRLGL
jgi:methyltransferase (TIGR00027 family)